MIKRIKKLLIFSHGQSLVELLIVIGLSSILLPAILTGFYATRNGRAQQDQRLHALSYLREAEEAINVVETNGWSQIANGTYHPVVSGNTWALTSGQESLNGSNFTRKIVIEDVFRDTDGNIVSSGGTLDPSSKLVTTTVSWDTPIASEVSQASYLTRHTNKVYTETAVADFNTGILNQTQVTTVSGGEVKLANNNKGKWCSPAFSSSAIDLPDGPPVAVAATASATSILTPNEAFVVTSPNTSNSIKLAYVRIDANTDSPQATLSGKFTMDAAQYSNPAYVPTGTGLDNIFKTNDVKYYKSSGNKKYALIATDLPGKEVLAILIDDNDPSNDSTTTGEYADPANKIFKYWTYFNTNIYAGALATTSFMNPTSHQAETSNAGDNNGFASNPTRAYSDNNSFAVDTDSGSNTGTSCTDTDKDKHRFYNYNFPFPAGAAVDGIEVHLDAKIDNTTGSPKMCVELSWDGGTTWTTAKSTSTLTTGEVTYTLGGSSDTWGRTWNSADVANSNFRVRVINVASDTSRDFSLDYVGVKIHSNSSANDYAPHDYGVTSLAVLKDKGYVVSGGYMYVFDLSNIDGKSTGSALDMIGCRIQLDGYDCKPGSPAIDKKYTAGETGGTWSNAGFPAHNDCSDGGNIELNATNDIYPVETGGNTYVFAAVGAGTNPEFNIVNATSVPTSGTSPAISSNSCGRISGGNSGWQRVGSYDFNTNSGTEEAANSVFAKDDGTRAYITSNGGTASKQYYILNTTNKSSPAFLSGSPSTGPSSGYYNASGANGELYPRRAMTVQNGIRAVLVGKDGISNGNDAQEYQVLDSTTEATPTYCGGLNYDIGFNDLTSVSELDGDNYVYMVANTAVNELKIIQGGPDNAIFVPAGTFESQIYNATSDAMFNRFYVNAVTLPQTTLTYQVAIGKAVDNSCSAVTYSYVGPDGTTGTYFATSSALPISTSVTGYQNPGQCMRYKTYMTSSDQLQTPILYDINFNYSP